MITLLMGDNGWAIKQALDKLRREFIKNHGTNGLEQIEAGDLDPNQLASLLQNSTLFSVERMVILRDVDDNKAIVEALPGYLENLAETVHLVIIAAKPDKRTRWYRQSSRIGSVKLFDELNEPALNRWAITRAKELGVQLQPEAARLLISRIGLNQWQVDSELAKLAAYDLNITKRTIELLVEPSPRDSVFDLLDTVVKGQTGRAHEIYDQLRLKDIDAHQFIGMLSWQIHNLLIVKANTKTSPGRLASQAGLAPFVINKTRNLASGLSLVQIKNLIKLTIRADLDIKQTRADVDQRVKLLIDQIGLTVR